MASGSTTTFRAIFLTTLLAAVAFSSMAGAQTHGNATWTVLIYLDAEGNLEESGVDNMLEMEAMGVGERARVLVQMDRGPDYDERDGDWQGTHRYEVGKTGVAGDGDTLSSNMLEDLGESNMGDPQTLVDFLNWGVKTAPADHYLVIMWNHGAAWDGVAWDHTPVEDHLSLTELNAALDQARRESNLDAWDIVYFDACVMGAIEVAHAVGDTARYVIASEELVPGAGGSYTALMEALQETTAVSPTELAGRLVKAFGARYAGDQGTGAGGHKCEGACGARSFDGTYAAYNDDDAVLSWYDMSKEPALWTAWTSFNAAIQKHAASEWALLVREAKAADRYNYEDAKAPDAMDIGDFAKRVRDGTTQPELKASADAVVKAVTAFVGGYTTSPSHPTSTGLMAKFPVPTAKPAGAKESVHATDPQYAEANGATAALASAAKDADSTDPEFGAIDVKPNGAGVRITITLFDANPYAIDIAITEEESENGEVLAWIRPTTIEPMDGGVTATFDWDGDVLALEGGETEDGYEVIAPAFTESLEATEYMLEGVYRVGTDGEEQDALLRFDLDGNLLSAWIVEDGASQVKPRLGDHFAPLFLGWDEDGEEIELLDAWVPAAKAGNEAWKLVKTPLGEGATGFAAYAEDLAGNSALSEPIIIELGTPTDEPDTTPVTPTPDANEPEGTIPAAETDEEDDTSTPGLPLLGVLGALAAVAVLGRRRRA